MQSNSDGGDDNSGETVWIWRLIWQLIKKARSGDREAATKLFDIQQFVTWCKSIAAIARRGGIDGDYRDINDFLQELLLRIWTRITQFKGTTMEEFSCWVLQIARNLQKDYLKPVIRERVLFEKNGLDNVDCPSSDDVFETTRANILREELKEFMDEKDDFDQRILEGHSEGRTLEEIARELDSSKSTVERHLKKTQKALMEKFSDRIR
jgi:RNA polymerase sigma factor (sigma-70 family)